MIELDPIAISALLGVAIPLVVAILTSEARTATGWRKTIALALSAAVGVLVTALEGGDMLSLELVVAMGAAFVSNISAYLGVWKDTPAINGLYSAGAKLGA